MPKFRIPELKAEIEAKDQKEFEEKKAKLLNRHKDRYTTGGVKRYNYSKIKTF